MSKTVSGGQALQVVSSLAVDTFWDELDGDLLQREFIELPPKERGIRFTEFLKNGGRIQIADFFRETGELTIQIPARPQPTLEEIQKRFPGIKAIEGVDHSPTEAVTLKLVTVLREGESLIGGTEYERRIAPHQDIILGYQQAIWLEEHQDEFPEFMALLGKIYIDFSGLVVVDGYDDRHVFYLLRGDRRWDVYCGWLGCAFDRDGRVASSSKQQPQPLAA